jgi:DNA-directed RNA polymerase subunit RPC12/RpoP
MDIYKCEKCGIIFDEFEMDYKQAQIDKKCLCEECRNKNKTLTTITQENEYEKTIF